MSKGQPSHRGERTTDRPSAKCFGEFGLHHPQTDEDTVEV